MNRTKKKPVNPNKPFFTRFLQQQELQEVNAGTTLKFPSDNDEEDGGDR
jgi:hypothetical protein